MSLFSEKKTLNRHYKWLNILKTNLTAQLIEEAYHIPLTVLFYIFYIR